MAEAVAKKSVGKALLIGWLVALGHTGTANAQLPVVTIVASDAEAAELGANPGEFTVTRTGGDMTTVLEVFYSLRGSSAGPSDYEAISLPVTIPANASSVAMTITPIQDVLVEGTETLSLAIGPQSTYEIGSPNSAVVEIEDDDVLPIVTIVATDANASEFGLDPGEFTFQRDGGFMGSALTIFFGCIGLSPNADYEFFSSPVIIPINASEIVVPVTPLADNAVEGTETLTCTLLPQSTYEFGDPISASVDIADNSPVVSIIASDPEAIELSADSGEFTLSRMGGDLASELRVFFNNSGSTADSQDYEAVANPLVIPANATAVAVPIIPVQDELTEDPETLRFSIGPQNTYLIGSPDSASVIISDGSDLFFTDSFEVEK